MFYLLTSVTVTLKVFYQFLWFLVKRLLHMFNTCAFSPCAFSPCALLFLFTYWLLLSDQLGQLDPISCCQLNHAGHAQEAWSFNFECSWSFFKHSQEQTHVYCPDEYFLLILIFAYVYFKREEIFSYFIYIANLLLRI